MTQVQLSDAEWESIESYLPISRFGPYPERLRQQCEGVIWRFRTGGQWREMPAEFGAWPTVHNRFRQWRDAGVFQALLEGLIAEAARRDEVDLSLVSIDSTTVRAHQDAAGMQTSSPRWRRPRPKKKPGPFLTIFGSKEPSRSRGTVISTGPTSVRTVLERVPLRELPPSLTAGSCLS